MNWLNLANLNRVLIWFYESGCIDFEHFYRVAMYTFIWCQVNNLRYSILTKALCQYLSQLRGEK